MQEFVKRLIERLEEEQKYQYAKAEEADKKINLEFISVSEARRKRGQCFDAAIQVVNQLAEEYKPKTQADRIRAMSDEELAEFLRNTVWQNGANLFDCNEYLHECCVGHCEQCNAYLKWLQERTETHE